MKYILIGILMVLVATSCYKDLGNYDYGNKTAIQVDSIKNLYEAYSGDTLHIVPEVTSYSDIVSYEWSVYDSLQAQGEVTILSNEKELHHLIVLPQGLYQLQYKVTDVDGYSQITTSLLSVVTTYSEGFYVLKEIEGNSDLDLYPTNNSPVPDIMYNMYEERIQGLPQDLFIAPAHKYIDTAAATEYVIYPITDKETRMVKVQDMTTIFNYEDFFYVPPTEKEQPLFFYYGGNCALLTDRNAYSYQTNVVTVSGKYGDHAAYINGNTAIEPTPYIVGSLTFYDDLNGQFLRMNEFNTLFQYRDVTPSGQENRIVPPFGLNCKMVYMKQTKMGGLSSMNTTPYAVMENNDNGERYLFTLDKRYISSSNYNPIIKADTFPQDLHIYEAEHFALSENAIYLFYTVGSQVYSYDITTKTERAVNLDLGGENICMMDYLFWRRDPQWDKFIIATSDGENYKLYFFNTRADLPDTSVEPTVYEGRGKPKAIHYVSPTTAYAYQYPFN